MKALHALAGLILFLAGAWAGKNLYDLIIAYLLKPIIAALAATHHAEVCGRPGPDPGLVARLAIEKLADLLRTVICAGNRLKHSA